MSSFSGINVALSALQAHRRAMDITGQNVANANTAGYTRQRADLLAVGASAGSSVHSLPPTVGNGVTVTGISRSNDAFLDAKVAQQASGHADLAGRAATLSALEGLTTEPTDQGLAAQLDAMWHAWSDVANHPEDASARTVVLNKTQAVVDAIRGGAQRVQALWENELTQAGSRVAEVNEAAKSVADLNARILQTVSAGGNANELMDRRDQLVTRLSELTGATAQRGDKGVVDVHLGGNALVAYDRAATLSLSPSPAAMGAPVTLAWAGQASGHPQPAGGELAASLAALAPASGGASQHNFASAAARYDAIAAALASSVNAVHSTGYQLDGVTPAGPLLSSTTTAGGLALLVSDPAALGAGTGTAGKGRYDGSVAAELAGLGADPSGPNGIWKSYVAGLGTQSAAASQRAAVAQTTFRAAVADQHEQAGVSLDEESANLLAMQRAYEGAARVLTAVDEALDVLINRTGLVGR